MPGQMMSQARLRLSLTQAFPSCPPKRWKTPKPALKPSLLHYLDLVKLHRSESRKSGVLEQYCRREECSTCDVFEEAGRLNCDNGNY